MKLHEDVQALEDAIRATANYLSLPVAYIEKDYWVTKALKELALSSVGQDIVFKGGTSLSKAYRLISRFSEDIDIAVLTEGLSTSQVSRKVKKASHVFSSIFEEIKSIDTSKNSRFRKVRFAYPRIDGSYIEGQITDSLLLEVNAFSDPEPYRKMHISSYIAEFLIKTEQKNELARFELESFELNVLCTSRTLCEKLMALVKASYGKHYIDSLRHKIRHIYDVYYLLEDSATKEIFESNFFQIMLSRVVASDQAAFPLTPWLDQPLANTSLFAHFDTVWPELRNTYKGVFKMMVVNKSLPTEDMLQEKIFLILEQLKVYDKNQC